MGAQITKSKMFKDLKESFGVSQEGVGKFFGGRPSSEYKEAYYKYDSPISSVDLTPEEKKEKEEADASYEFHQDFKRALYERKMDQEKNPEKYAEIERKRQKMKEAWDTGEVNPEAPEELKKKWYSEHKKVDGKWVANTRKWY